MLLHIRIAGILLIALASLHLVFKKYFNWREELSSLNLINRQIMTVHTFFIAFTVLLMGLLCITSSKELLESVLGKKILLGLGVFWSIRLFVQFFVYSSEHWRGRKFETRIHFLCSVLWCYLSLVFWISALK